MARSPGAAIVTIRRLFRSSSRRCWLVSSTAAARALSTVREAAFPFRPVSRNAISSSAVGALPVPSSFRRSAINSSVTSGSRTARMRAADCLGKSSKTTCRRKRVVGRSDALKRGSERRPTGRLRPVPTGSVVRNPQSMRQQTKMPALEKLDVTSPSPNSASMQCRHEMPAKRSDRHRRGFKNSAGRSSRSDPKSPIPGLSRSGCLLCCHQGFRCSNVRPGRRF